MEPGDEKPLQERMQGANICTGRYLLVPQQGTVAGYSAATVHDILVGQGRAAGADLYNEKRGKLGPDPLREDADKELLWERMQKSKAPVGRLLMDQDAVAGIGNIYRAEILYKVVLHDASYTHSERVCPGPIIAG